LRRARGRCLPIPRCREEPAALDDISRVLGFGRVSRGPENRYG